MDGRLDRLSFENALTKEKMLVFRLVQGGLGLGILIFGIVVLILNMTIEPSAGRLTETALRPVQILSLVTLVLTLSTYTAAFLVNRFFFDTDRLSKRMGKELRDEKGGIIGEPAEKFIHILLHSTILRLALLEGSALFGLVVCQIAVVWGVLQVRPLYWLNALPAAIMIAYVVATFPSRERILNTFQNEISGNPVGM